MPWVTVWVCDSFALFTGMAFGKHKLAPYVSPKKTIEGSIGGLVFAVIACVVYALVMNNCFGQKDGAIPVIKAAALGNEAGIIGAAAL